MIEGLIALILSLGLTPYVTRMNKRAGIVGRDVHKANKPEIPEMGGIAVVIAVIFASAVGKVDSVSLAVFSLFALLGVLDDLTGMRQLHKVMCSLLFALPVIPIGGEALNVFGHKIPLGALYGMFALLFVTTSANLVNMLAGFNGLELGTSAIALGVLSFITTGTAKELSLIGLGASLGFLFWNKYPARVFPGDVGTLSVGSLIGIIGIVGHVEGAVALLLLPHSLDFILKAVDSKFGVRKRGGAKIDEDGRLVPPNYRSFLGLLIKATRPKEWELVLFVWLIELILGGIVLLLS